MELGTDRGSPAAPGVDDSTREDVETILSALEKTSRMYRLYPENNRILRDFVTDLSKRFTRYLESHGQLEITVDEDRLLFQGEQVLVGSEAGRATALLLYRDGIHQLVFYRGLTEREILDYLSVTTTPPDPDSLEDDLVTLLWAKDFAHLSYTVVDTSSKRHSANALVDADTSSAPSGHERDITIDLWGREEVAEAGSSSGSGTTGGTRTVAGTTVTLPEASVARTIFTLTDRDLEDLRKLLVHERARDLNLDLSTLLYEMLSHTKVGEAFAMSVRALGTLCGTFLAAGEFSHATEVHRRLTGALAWELSESNRKVLQSELDRIAGKEAMESAVSQLEHRREDNSSDVKTFFKSLGSKVIPTLLELSREAKNFDILTSLLAEIGAENPDLLIERIYHPDPVVVRQVVAVLGRMADPAVAVWVLPALDHTSVTVRIEAVKALGRMGGRKAGEGLVNALRDPEPSIRLLALGWIEECPAEEVLDRLLEIVTNPGFADRSVSELRETYRVLGKIGGETAVPILEKAIAKKTLFRLGKKDEQRASAAAGLGAAGTREARRILEEQTRSSSKVVREACEKALTAFPAATGASKADEG